VKNSHKSPNGAPENVEGNNPPIGSFLSDADANPISNNQAGSMQEGQSQKTVSSRKREANQQNAKKSTGPKTVRGKRYSSLNGVRHGLLSKKLMFAADGTPINPEFARLFERLHEEYGRGDVAGEILIELAAVDYWRVQKGLEYEFKYLTPKGGEFHPQGAMPTLIRYQTANRRALDKTLQMLAQLRVQHETEMESEVDSDAIGPIPAGPGAQSGPGGNPTGVAGPAATQESDRSEGENAAPVTGRHLELVAPAAAANVGRSKEGGDAA